MRIGVIGTGTIATAVVRGIVGEDHRFVISARSVVNSSALASRHDNVEVAENQQVLDRSEVIFLGLMAGTAQSLLPGLRFRADQQVVSLMAGVSLQELAGLVAPARAAALMIPFPSIADGGSPILAQGDTGLIRRLFGERNSIFEPDGDAEMEAFLCAQAVLSPVAQMVAETAGWLGERVCDPDQGEAFLRQLIVSSLRNTQSAALVEALNTPGGYNQRLRMHMEHSGLGKALCAGLDDLEGKA